MSTAPGKPRRQPEPRKPEPWCDKVRDIYEAALKAGTHSRTANHACRACGEWRPTYHITFDGSGICLPCAVKQGVNGAAEHLKAEGSTAEAQRTQRR